jgi:hypothetical protein
LDPRGRSALQQSLSELKRMAHGLDDTLEIGGRPA